MSWPLRRPCSKSFWLSWPLSGTTLWPKWLQLGRLDPLRPFKNLCFPQVFHTFQEIATFAMKSPKRPQNACPDPSGGPVRGHFWPSWPPLGATLGPQTPPKEPQCLNFDVILATLSHMFRSCRPNGSQASSWSPKSTENVSKNDL